MSDIGPIVLIKTEEGRRELEKLAQSFAHYRRPEAEKEAGRAARKAPAAAAVRKKAARRKGR